MIKNNRVLDWYSLEGRMKHSSGVHGYSEFVEVNLQFVMIACVNAR